MRAVVRGLLVSVFLCAPAWAAVNDPEGVLTAGNTAYQSGEYAKAAKLYRQLATGGFESGDLFYNLGTAELRAGRRGEAILWFERALRLEPHDGDVQFNLAEARRGNIDKVVGAREEATLVERVGERVPVTATGAAFVGAWLLAFAALIIRRLQSRARSVLLSVGLVSGVVAVASAVLLWTAWWQRTQVRHAVVVAASSAVREGPASDFRTAFEIHEGLKVRVVREKDGFLRVRLPNGSEGWVVAADAPVI